MQILKPEIKKRIEQIQKGVAPKGYKKTKVGIVPNEWKERSFDSLFTFDGGLSIPRDRLTNEGIIYLHYGDIHTREKNYIDIAAEENTMPKILFDISISGWIALEDGDIVFVDASEDCKGIGKSVVVYNQKQRSAIAGLHTIVAKCKTRNLFRDYKRFFLQTMYIRKQFVFYATGVSVFGVTKNNIGKIIACLPSLSEQEKIAEILSTWDKAIELKEQFITEKKQQKKWLIQNLLTGKKRLPGFTEGWQDVRLGAVCKNVLGGGTPSRNVEGYYKGNIPWVTVKDLDGAKQKYDSIEHINLDAVRQSASKIIPKGNLIVSTRMGLGRGFINMVDMAINQDMKGIMLDNTLVSTEFIYYCFIELGNYLERLGNGSTVKGVDLSTLLNLIINLPPLPEQIAIAEILSTADHEIDLHEKQLEELKKQKKALMQLLLTGIVRVKAQEVS